jgi:hypothetical protein
MRKVAAWSCSDEQSWQELREDRKIPFDDFTV